LAWRDSGVGKDSPRKINKSIIHQIGKLKCTGEDFASGEALQDALLKTPSMFFQNDEIAQLMQAIKLGNDPRFIGIEKALLSIYSSSTVICPCDARQFRVEAKRKKIQIRKTIRRSISHRWFCLAFRFRKQYYAALNEAMITNGLLGRMLIIEAGKKSEGQEPKIIREIPDSIMLAAWHWDEMHFGSGNAHEVNPDPLIVEATPDAKNALIEIRKANDARWQDRDDRSDTIGMALWGRATEIIRKLSLIYAASENYEEPQITLAGVEWGLELATCATERMIYMSKTHLVANPFHALMQKVKRLLAAAPDRTLSKSIILRKLQIDARLCDSVLNTLIQSGDVIQVESEHKGRGRTAELYRLIRVDGD
jgi:hypothetical protein